MLDKMLVAIAMLAIYFGVVCMLAWLITFTVIGFTGWPMPFWPTVTSLILLGVFGAIPSGLGYSTSRRR